MDAAVRHTVVLCAAGTVAHSLYRTRSFCDAKTKSKHSELLTAFWLGIVASAFMETVQFNSRYCFPGVVKLFF